MLIKEAIANKKLILLSGPSASGKSYLAENTLGAKNWYEGDTSVALIGTDNFGGESKKTFPKFSKLLKEFGCPELAKFKEDWHWLIELYKDDYKKWQEVASDEEKKKYSEYLTDQLHALPFLNLMMRDRMCYGNAFASVVVPFRRFLQCPRKDKGTWSKSA